MTWTIKSGLSVLLVLLPLLSHGQQQRSPPGVNPQQYQGGVQGGHPPPPPPPQPGQFQGQPPQQFQGQPPQQFQGQPPQQFQGQPPPQQFQGQPPQQFQGQPPQQFQGQPQQQFQPQPGQGQPPQQQVKVVKQGAHGQQQVLHRDMNHERDHMKEHMEVPIDTSNMSEQELQFHYFKMHDADGNNKLDGCELVKSLIHWHDGDSHGEHSHDPPPHYEDEQLAFLVDPVLQNDDVDNDGMIDYAEFIAAQIKTQMGLREGVTISV